jgi:hypothetical protein
MKPRSSGGEVSATYLLAVSAGLDAVLVAEHSCSLSVEGGERSLHGNNHGQRSHTHTNDESATKNGVVSSLCCRTLDDHTDDENSCVDDDGIFAGEDLGEESAVHCPGPRTQLEN